MPQGKYKLESIDLKMSHVLNNENNVSQGNPPGDSTSFGLNSHLHRLEWGHLTLSVL